MEVIEQMDQCSDNTVANRDKDNEPADERFFSINLHILPAKFAYLFRLAIYDKLLFSLLFYNGIGMSIVDAGLINGIQHAGGILISPVIAFMADKTRWYKQFAIGTCLLTVLANAIQPLLSLKYGDKRKNVCPYVFNHTSYENNEYPSGHNSKVLFWSLMVASILASAFETNARSFIDSGVLQRMKTSKRPVQFGRQRLFGAFGMVMGTLSNSLSITYFPHTQITCYTGIFVAYSVYGVGLAITSYFIFKGLTFERKEERKSELTDILLRSLKDYELIFFFIGVLLHGIIHATIYTFSYAYLKELGAPTMLFGYSMAVAGIGGLLASFFSAWIIEKCGGPLQAAMLTWFFTTLRCVGLATAWSPYFLFFPDSLTGMSYTMFWIVCVEYLNRRVDPAALTTLCGIMNSLFTPFSFLVANVFAGHFYNVFGGRKLFICSSVIGAAWFLIMFVYIAVKSRRNKRPK